jgi:L-fuconolactonase
MMLFDSHAHINTTDVANYPVAPVDGHLPETALSDAFPVESLIAAMDESGVARALMVQRSHVYGYDNSYILDSAARFPDRLKPLCVIDGRIQSAADQARAGMARGSVGIRFMEPEKGKGLDWLASDHARDAWAATVAAGGSIRVHLFRWNRADGLAVIAKRLSARPETVLVLDHLSNLDPEQGDHGVDDSLRALAEHPTTSLMLSMINLKRWAADGIEAAPVIERVVALFGADRVMWGSDVGNTPGGYGDMITRAQNACAGLSASDQQKIFHDTAARIYGH